jgi:excisionase family DNA binding protein
MSKNMESLNEICSTREASEALGVSQRTVQLWVESGVLNAWKSPGGHRKITVASVNKILQGRVASIQTETSSNNEEFVILYVEDDLAQQALFSNFTSRLKNKVKLQLASNGFEGLISLGKTKPDLLITDLKMPGMDGFEMINHLQKNEEFGNLKIIVFSSMTEQEIVEHGGLPSNIQVITKPVPLNNIGLLIDSLVLAKNK